MNKYIILLSKDAMLTSYLPTYGNSYWNTPNISELARKGTVFRRHYTAAPSTAMAFTSMFTGLYPFQLNRSKYEEVEEYKQGTTLFDEMHKLGYECHLLWSKNYIYMAEKYSKCYGMNTIRHENEKFNQSVGVHMPKKKSLNHLSNDFNLEKNTMAYLRSVVEALDMEKKIFLWIHLPHVLLGRSGYGQDIDLLDDFVGFLRRKFGDDSIYITADHGNMNGVKGKTTYGFDVYEPAIKIPLITPRINDLTTVDFPTSNIQLMDIILNGKVRRNDFVISDTQYYAQPFRKMAVIFNNYKYIYNKIDGSEELYDLDYDENENINLLKKTLYDSDRNRLVNVEQVVFYPYMDKAQNAYEKLRLFRLSIWKNASKTVEFKNLYLRKMKNFKAMLKRHL